MTVIYSTYINVTKTGPSSQHFKGQSTKLQSAALQKECKVKSLKQTPVFAQLLSASKQGRIEIDVHVFMTDRLTGGALTASTDPTFFL